jgi:trk system potassium uptake protein
MLNIRPVIYILGLLSCAMSAILCVPAITDAIFGNPEWHVFLNTALAALFIGGVCVSATRTKGRVEINIRQAFLITALGRGCRIVSPAVHACRHRFFRRHV